MKVTIKALRVNANMSQQEAANALGITARTLQNWENGITSPTASQLISVCDLYKCTLNDIFLPIALAKSESE